MGGSLRDDLIAAKALIDTPEKWRKDDSSLDAGSCCAVIAVNRVVNRGKTMAPFPEEHASTLAQALPERWLAANEQRIARENDGCMLVDEPGIYVGEFNDDPATTHADVMALFDRAIAAAPTTDNLPTIAKAETTP